MLRLPTRVAWAATLIALSIATSPRLGQAQLAGGNLRGDFGIASGTQPDPHFYLSGFYTHYGTNKIFDADGNVRPNVNAEIGVNAFAAFAWWVTDARILGANYSALAYISLANSAIEYPALGVESASGYGIGDLYVQPINLGWHRDRADFMLGAGVYVPTGRWEAGGDDNIGLGMWGFELQAGSTVYLDRGRQWSIAALAAWETHGKKRDTDIKVGDIITVEGGLGRAFLQGALTAGVAYSAQWKITQDDLGLERLPELSQLRKARAYSAGPDVSFVVPVKGKVVATAGLRYLWDFGIRNGTEGDTFMAFLTFPIPSIPLS